MWSTRQLNLAFEQYSARTSIVIAIAIAIAIAELFLPRCICGAQVMFGMTEEEMEKSNARVREVSRSSEV